MVGSVNEWMNEWLNFVEHLELGYRHRHSLPGSLSFPIFIVNLLTEHLISLSAIDLLVCFVVIFTASFIQFLPFCFRLLFLPLFFSRCFYFHCTAVYGGENF